MVGNLETTQNNFDVHQLRDEASRLLAQVNLLLSNPLYAFLMSYSRLQREHQHLMIMRNSQSGLMLKTRINALNRALLSINQEWKNVGSLISRHHQRQDDQVMKQIQQLNDALLQDLEIAEHPIIDGLLKLLTNRERERALDDFLFACLFQYLSHEGFGEFVGSFISVRTHSVEFETSLRTLNRAPSSAVA